MCTVCIVITQFMCICYASHRMKIIRSQHNEKSLRNTSYLKSYYGSIRMYPLLILMKSIINQFINYKSVMVNRISPSISPPFCWSHCLLGWKTFRKESTENENGSTAFTRNLFQDMNQNMVPNLI